MTTKDESRLAWLLALASDSAPESISETHAVIVGLLCGRPEQDKAQLATHLAALQVGDWTSERILEELGPALAQLQAELDSDRMDFQPLLPADNRPLAERTRCLAHWCSGFLTGLGAAGPTIRSEDGADALRMLEQIARAATDAGADQEEEESAFFELVEFVRIAALMLREECRADAADP